MLFSGFLYEELFRWDDFRIYIALFANIYFRLEIIVNKFHTNRDVAKFRHLKIKSKVLFNRSI
jgi:hypothetical protein